MSRRSAIAMSTDEVDQFLTTARTAVLVSLDRGGVPHPVAMWFVAVDGQIRFASYTKSQKVVNLRRDERVAVLVEDGDTYESLRGVMVQGRAVVSDEPAAVLDIERRLSAKYRGRAPGLDEPDESELLALAAKRSVVVVEPDVTTSWDHGKLPSASH